MTITIFDQHVNFTTGIDGTVFIRSIDGVELDEIEDQEGLKEIKAELENEIMNSYMDMREDEEQRSNYYSGRG